MVGEPLGNTRRQHYRPGCTRVQTGPITRLRDFTQYLGRHSSPRPVLAANEHEDLRRELACGECRLNLSAHMIAHDFRGVTGELTDRHRCRRDDVVVRVHASARDHVTTGGQLS